MNRQEKIDKIYSVIADKTLSFGCKMKDNEKIVKYIGVEVYGPDDKYDSIWDGYRIEKNLSRKMNDLENYEIIGHPVMIGDVLDYFQENHTGILKLYGVEYNSKGRINLPKNIFILWKNKRKPIEEQSDECVDFVYNLISKKG